METRVRIRVLPKLVTLEPDLESSAGHLGIEGRRSMAARYWRYAKQLYASADLLELHARAAHVPASRPQQRPPRPPSVSLEVLRPSPRSMNRS